MIDPQWFAAAVLAGSTIGLSLGLWAVYGELKDARRDRDEYQTAYGLVVRELRYIREKLPRRGPRGRFVKHKGAK